MEQDMAREVGESILTALRSGESVEDLLGAESLVWNERSGVQRGQFDMNTEIVGNVFSMSAPESGSVNIEGFGLNNGAYVVIELQAVNPGSVEQLDEGQREQLVAAIMESRGRSTFDGLLANLQNSARIR